MKRLALLLLLAHTLLAALHGQHRFTQTQQLQAQEHAFKTAQQHAQNEAQQRAKHALLEDQAQQGIASTLLEEEAMESLLEHLASSAQDHQVRILNLQHQRRAGTANTWQHHTLSIQPQGSYTALVQWLGGLIQHWPALTIAQLDMQRSSPKAPLQFDLQLAVYTHSPESRAFLKTPSTKTAAETAAETATAPNADAEHTLSHTQRPWFVAENDLFTPLLGPAMLTQNSQAPKPAKPPKPLQKAHTSPTNIAATAPTQPPIQAPMPYQAMAVLNHQGRTTVFLRDENNSQAVQVGDTLGQGQYRVVHIDPNSAQLLYLPWGTLHTLELPQLELPPPQTQPISAPPTLWPSP